MDYEKNIDIPFGAKDSELKGWEYTIPEGMEAIIKDGKVIVREKESEDERIRKEIIHYILYKANGVSEKQEHEWIAYLERQKEQKPLSTEETELNSLAFLEQIAQDYVKGVKECNQEPTWDLIQTAVCYGYHLAEQRSSEWSEEDSRTIGTLSSIIFDYAFHKDALDENNDLTDEYAELYNWLQYLPEKFNLQPKQEWSEEDEEMIARICANLEYIAKEAGCDSKVKEKLEERIKWMKRLKSLRPRPHWKPSEKEMGALRTAIHVLSEERNFPKAAAQLQNILNTFEGEKPRKDWKPSEEQMKWLKDVIETVPMTCRQQVPLESLYADLKKL